MQTQVEFFEANAVDGKLTPEQMMEMMSLPEGEIGAALGTESDATGQATDSANEKTAEGESANAVILAKDGVHTIPFEKLQEARDAAKQSRQALEAMQAQLDQAKQQLEEAKNLAQARADAGQAPTTQDKQLATVEKALDAGVDPAIFGDFTEADIAKGVATLVAQSMANVDKLVEAEVSKRLAPLAAREARSAEEMHFSAILTAHPDADSITESAELAQWKASKPTFMRASIDAVLEKGTSQEVIELFDTFKAETQKAGTGATNVDDLRAKALAKVQAVEQAAPLSLTGIPGAVLAADDSIDALTKLDGAQLLDKLMGMSPEKVNQVLNRMI